MNAATITRYIAGLEKEAADLQEQVTTLAVENAYQRQEIERLHQTLAAFGDAALERTKAFEVERTTVAAISKEQANAQIPEVAEQLAAKSKPEEAPAPKPVKSRGRASAKVSKGSRRLPKKGTWADRIIRAALSLPGSVFARKDIKAQLDDVCEGTFGTAIANVIKTYPHLFFKAGYGRYQVTDLAREMIPAAEVAKAEAKAEALQPKEALPEATAELRSVPTPAPLVKSIKKKKRRFKPPPPKRINLAKRTAMCMGRNTYGHEIIAIQVMKHGQPGWDLEIDGKRQHSWWPSPDGAYRGALRILGIVDQPDDDALSA